MKSLILNLFIVCSLFATNDFYYESGKKIELKPQLSQQNLNTQNEILQYETTDGKTLKFKNELLVQCKKNAYCEDDFSDLVITDYEELATGYFLIKINSDQNIFNIAQQLYLKDDIETAHPNYVKNKMKR